MTVQNMDICLNVSAEPASVASVKRNEKIDSVVRKSIKKLKKQSVNKKKSVTGTSASTQTNKKTRVKQKFLAAIVARKLNEQNNKMQEGSVAKSLEKSGNPRASSNKDSSENSTVSFTKVPKDNLNKAIVARKRNVNDTTTKKSLSDIYANQSINLTENKMNLKLLPNVSSKDKIDASEKDDILKLTKENHDAINTTKDYSSRLLSKKSKKDVSREGNVSDLWKGSQVVLKNDSSTLSTKKSRRDNLKNRDAKPTTKKLNSFDKKKNKKHEESIEIKSEAEKGHITFTGKISSLFRNNPEVPHIGQRLVKPISEPVFTAKTFSDLGVHKYMVSNLEQTMNITKLTMVQQKAIPQILSGKDVLIRSQTGSGKTLAYAVPIVEKLQRIRPKLKRNSGLKALIVVPTRELALQSLECFVKLTKSFTWIVPGYLVGGERRKAEKVRLRKGCNILVGTPGRLLDHIKHTVAMKLNHVEYFVLDEADRMLDAGYEKDIAGIVDALKNAGTNSSYDPMELLRKNTRKVFTEEELEECQQNNHQDQGTQENQGTLYQEESKQEEEEEEQEEEEEESDKMSYHSNSDSEQEDDDFPIKSKKIMEKKRNKKKTKKETNCSETKEDEKASTKSENSDSRKVAATENKRQTILLSATLTQAVKRLAGLAMDSPIFIDAARENLTKVGGDLDDVNEDFVVPQSVNQTYIVTPAKLRMVTLSAYIAAKCKAPGEHKILVFMATQDMVDYYCQALSSVLNEVTDEENDDDDNEDAEPLVDAKFFQLHGSMKQKERTEVFKTFRQANSSILLCTDVAARGLDLPKVDCVIQYTGPLSVRDYVHRIGRTARAGTTGSAVIFLTPAEVEFVRMLESKRIRIKQEDMDSMLDKLLGPLSKYNSVQHAATALQNEFETLLLKNPKLYKLACKAYVSWVRFYSSYPRDMREIFNRKELHLGHYAKSFALRDPPQRIGGVGKSQYEKDVSTKPKHNNRLTIEQRPQESSSNSDGGKAPALPPTKTRKNFEAGLFRRKFKTLEVSEYDSGLEPLSKKPKRS